jgi:cyclopropane fatty-acyl-phospholipid synthase-like methyltransferase
VVPVSNQNGVFPKIFYIYKILQSMISGVDNNSKDILYEHISYNFYEENWIQNKKNYMNLGYWNNINETMDKASENLVELVGKTANLCENDSLLDVGFGN